jgi:UPF0271 protein
MSKKIDLNSDVRESFGVYRLDLDEEVIPNIASANIACGFHVGDPGAMRKTVFLAKKYSVEIVAHPGYPDLKGFGRRNTDVSQKEMQEHVVNETLVLFQGE